LPKRLSILRHAKSDWGEAGLKDFDRPLNARGREAAKAIGKEIAKRGWSFDVILSSPSARTRETLDRAGLADRARWQDEIYLATRGMLFSLVRSLPDEAGSALIVGHNPGLQEVVLDIARPDSGGFRRRVADKFPTAALAVLDLDINEWSKIAAGCGTIADLLLPRELD